MENEFPELYINVEMTTLEDAYVNIAKAEIRAHDNRQDNDTDDSVAINPEDQDSVL